MVNVSIHPSQFPQNVGNELLRCLRERNVNPKFHYLTYKQSEKWLQLHDAYSPSRTDPDCAAIYDQAFASAARQISDSNVELIGLGCGGGQKDSRLVGMLNTPERKISYVPCDVSVALVLIAREASLREAPEIKCHPLVCDLARATDLPEMLASLAALDGPDANRSRLISFFGMVPNFEPSAILPRIASLLNGRSFLLLSANLAPGPDYDAGMKRILPGYDNGLTRDWLSQFLFDLGVEPSDGGIRFGIQEGGEHLKRVTAAFHFAGARNVNIHGETFRFAAGDTIRLFFSYRYTLPRILSTLDKYGLSVVDHWITRSDEEGVFLCKRR